MRDTVFIGLLAPVFAAAASLRLRITRRRTDIGRTEIGLVFGSSSTPVHHGRTIAPALGATRPGATERAA